MTDSIRRNYMILYVIIKYAARDIMSALLFQYRIY